MNRGEIRWYTFRSPDKRRPVLILTRDDVIDRLNEINVAPATRTIRGLTTEVVLTTDDGMPAPCVVGTTESDWCPCATCRNHDGPKSAVRSSSLAALVEKTAIEAARTRPI